jgi:hypothetical protein
MMHLTLTQVVSMSSTAGAAWLMVRAGTAKRRIVVRTPSRCAACGKRRTGGSCDCTAVL